MPEIKKYKKSNKMTVKNTTHNRLTYISNSALN